MYNIGIDLGGTNIAVGIVDENLNIICKGKTPTGAERSAEEIIKDMGLLCLDLLEEAKIGIEEIDSVGIAAPGSVLPDTGVLEYANNLPFRNTPIVDMLRKTLPVEKICLENDANAAALGEAVAGAAKGSGISVMITLGTGVGGGVVIDGKLFTGSNFAGTELGHTVIEYNGRPCSCGRCGCWEAYSSATALVRMTKEKMLVNRKSAMWEMSDNLLKNVSARTAFTAMKKGDKVGSEVVEEYISYLACGITNMINIFQPEILTIGGGVCNEKEWLIKPLVEKVDGEQYTRNKTKKCEIKTAMLGNDAGIIGAASLSNQKIG